MDRAFFKEIGLRGIDPLRKYIQAMQLKIYKHILCTNKVFLNRGWFCPPPPPPVTKVFLKY